MVTAAKPKVGLDRSKTGRRKGTPNKTTALLKEALLAAAELAGGEDTEARKGGLIGYLTEQAINNPVAFMALLGKVLPIQVAGDADNPVVQVIKLIPLTGD